MKYPVYPEMKDSGIEWLGVIPEHWKKVKVKYSTYVKGRIGWHGLTSDEYVGDGPFLVTGTDFKKGSIAWSSCYHISEERYNEDPYIQLKNGDLLITKDGTIGKTAIVKDIPGKAILNSGIFVTRPTTDSYIPRYLYWVLNSKVFNNYFSLVKTGSTVMHLYQETFEDFIFSLPKITEQKAIANFLDKETGRIDQLIEKKEQLISLLEEKRQATISYVVTKGLNSDVPMKDSGIEWLGEIPVHWDISKFRRYCYLNQGLQIQQNKRFVETGKNRYEYITIKSINSKSGENKEYIEEPPKKVICTPDDVLLARTGATGEVITGYNGVFHNNFFRINYKHLYINRNFLVYYLKNKKLFVINCWHYYYT